MGTIEYKKAVGNSLNVFVVDRLKAGDEDAFKYVFLRLKEPLFLFVSKMTGSKLDAEDICQEAFAALWLKREEIGEIKNVKTYLFGIAKNMVYGYLRKNIRESVIFTEAEAEFDTQDTLSPDTIIQLRETELLTKYAISKLPSRTREVYELHYSESLSNEQIARRLDMTPEHVRKQLSLAHKKIGEVILMLISACFLSV